MKASQRAELGQAMTRELRPRKRLLDRGPGALNDSELLSIILGIGKSRQSAVELSLFLLKEHQGLKGLLDADVQSLQRSGLGPAKVATVMAAVEFGCRLARQQMPKRRLMERPEKVAGYLRLRYGVLDQEVVGALFLDTHNRLLKEREFFRGTLSRTTVEPRPILRGALELGAASVILFRAHPSGGEPKPSEADLSFARKMAAAGEVLGVRLVDHMIIGGGGSWVSLTLRGMW